MPRSRHALAALAAVTLALALAKSAGAQRTLTMADFHGLRGVSDAQLSPDGEWVAFTVDAPDTIADKAHSEIWVVRWDGTQETRLTWSTEGERTPRWSPDGRWLAFLSSRGDRNERDQVWLLDRTGGEPRPLTNTRGGVSDFSWSPHGTHLAVVAKDPPASDSADDEDHPQPIVIDRLQFKKDYVGYLDHRRDHIYVATIGNGSLEQITRGDVDDALPAWSPDGKSIAFVSKRVGDPDRTDNWDVYVVDVPLAGEPRRLTTFDGADNDPDWGSPLVWSPDGSRIAYLQAGPQRLIYYAVEKLAVLPVAGGSARVLTPTLDRWVLYPAWSADGSSVLFLLEDDRTVQLGRVDVASGAITRPVRGRQVLTSLSSHAGKVVVVSSTPDRPAEVFALEKDSTLRQLSHQNDSLVGGVTLGTLQDFSCRSGDGTDVHGVMMLPPNYQAGRRYPTVVRVHGGPNEQWQTEFDMEFQQLAAQGWVVLAPNPRGGTGRGEAYSTAIFGRWGEKDGADVLASVDCAIARGIADPARLAIGGWSYGAILTDFIISKDTRFTSAVSGAGIGNALAGYGTDQYVREYENELGVPWKHRDNWLRMSRPFLEADRIVTPTLFMGGDKDLNVPITNSEQMYQALRSLGRDTKLVIYPGEYHIPERPSFLADRMRRYIDWYGSHFPAPQAAK